MRIAICDDDQEQLRGLVSLLEHYQKERRLALSYQPFLSATELLSTAEEGKYDLYLLDVLMPGLNGMETAREIRAFDKEAQIVFLTSSPEFAVESYQYQAQNYILKPITPARLFPTLDAVEDGLMRNAEGLFIKTNHGISRILFHRLAFAEVQNKKVFFHLTNGTVKEIAAPLSDFEEAMLSRREFVRVHRAFVVNLSQVAELAPGEILTLQGNKIPVSRKQYPQIREAYLQELFGRQGGLL